jgi:large subunit ribosomal protein L18
MKLNQNFERRKTRERHRLAQANNGRMRLTVFRSNSNIYAQIIDDNKSITLASASSLDKALSIKGKGNVESAIAVGKLIAERAKTSGVTQVFFDRGGYLFHGRIKALADAARENGLEF